MRKRLVDYWWLWIGVAIVAIVINEVIDRATSSGSHPAADVLIAIALVALAAGVWELMARRRSRGVT